MEGYSVKILSSNKELTAKERIMIKDTTSALKLDEVTQTEEISIKPEVYAVLEIFNEKSDNKTYKNYILIDKEGKKFVTGSDSFWNSFIGIAEEMEKEEEEWGVRVYRKPSKNYKGKEFITCTIE